MNRLRPYIKDIPFIMLLANLIAWIFYDINWIQYFNTQLTGASLLIIAYMLFYAHTHRYCLYSWVCIFGLGSLNSLNIIHFFLSLKEYYKYSGIILIASTIITFALIKWKTLYYKNF